MRMRALAFGRSLEQDAARFRGRCLVALVPADPLDVIPGGVLVAGIALVDLGVGLVGNLCAHITEVPSAMARRGWMALSTIAGAGRGVPERRDRPAFHAVTGVAPRPELTAMWIFLRVTGGTVQPWLGSETGRER